MTITKKTMYFTIIGFILITCIANNYFPKLSYSEEKSSNPYNIKNLNTLDNNKEYYSDEDNSVEDFNFVAVGDFSCNDDAKDTVRNILYADPDLLLGLGDYSYEKSATCWEDIVGGIDPQKMKISFCNHEFEDKSLVKQYMEYTNLDKQYYSFDYKNVHFISMATETPYEQGSQQFEFVKHDLMKTKTNPSIDWIIVYYHQPMYTSKTHHEGLESFRDLYHSLFNEYSVDLVLQGHIHNYQRSYPLIYNSENPSNPIIEQSAILDNSGDNEENNVYVEDEGTVFAIVGTGGQELHGLDAQAYFTANQFEDHGFLELKTINNGKSLVGQFYSNDGSIIKD
ncbi:MAG: metallophosphoesterase, partial [Nitrososphaeraceae archaeon]|nr:metallophosphoesterase [Nitrososphaeraceae archaeon]